jgi:amino acid transporter
MVPKAMVGTIVINFIAGLLFLIPVCFVLPDLTYLVNLASGQPTPAIFKAAIGNSVGAFCLLIPLLVLGIICGVGCVTATSRCTWAFARDGGIPGSGWWSTVHKTLDIPFNALVLGMIVEIILGVIYFGSTAAYNAFSGVGVIFLTTSYACPIAVSLIFRGREDIKNGSFNFGIWGLVANVFALGWSILAIPLFCMPTLKTVTKESMNYASVVFAGFIAIAAVWYGVWGYHNYRGPPTDAVDAAGHDESTSPSPPTYNEVPKVSKEEPKKI